MVRTYTTKNRQYIYGPWHRYLPWTGQQPICGAKMPESGPMQTSPDTYDRGHRCPTCFPMTPAAGDVAPIEVVAQGVLF